MSLLSFIYDTGRAQGMREERAKRKVVLRHLCRGVEARRNTWEP